MIRPSCLKIYHRRCIPGITWRTKPWVTKVQSEKRELSFERIGWDMSVYALGLGLLDMFFFIYRGNACMHLQRFRPETSRNVTLRRLTLMNRWWWWNDSSRRQLMSISMGPSSVIRILEHFNLFFSLLNAEVRSQSLERRKMSLSLTSQARPSSHFLCWRLRTA